jgi:uncharacterized membrane protein
MTNELITTIRKYLGWCPMAARVKHELGGRKAAVQPENAVDAGPVAGRAVLFSRLTLLVTGLSWLVAFAALPYLPETIPVHWNVYGEADGFAGRLAGAFGLPIIITLTAILLVVLPRFDRMRVSFDDARDIYAIVLFATVSLLLGIEVTTLLSSAGMDLPLAVVLPVLLGFFFIVVGRLMPHIRRNTTIGIRLPWTVRDEMVWKKTHEHGGPVFVIAGVLIVLGSAVAGTVVMPLAFGILVVAVLYITVWSYRLSRAGTTDGVE